MLKAKKVRRLLRSLFGIRENRSAWVTASENPSNPDCLKNFRFFAIIGPWYESDIIEATVKNAFTQGCERVYIIDNDSPDDTVKQAVSAGAILFESYKTEGFDHEVKYRLMNDAVNRISREEGDDHIWWLWLDADEFPHGPDGMTIREYLETLDKKNRIVGARNFNHFPSTEPCYISGFHPIEFQPYCQEFIATEFNHCDLGHWKHPLQRFDKQSPAIKVEPGFHRCSCADTPLIEPAQPILLHHFPYRTKEFTLSRLEKLCTKDENNIVRNQKFDNDIGRSSGITKRFRTIEHIYAKQWDKVENLHVAGSPIGVSPELWVNAVESNHVSFKKWYSADELQKKLPIK